MQMALGDDGGFAADDPVACLDMDGNRVLQVTREPDGRLKAKLARVGRGDLRLRLPTEGAQHRDVIDHPLGADQPDAQGGQELARLRYGAAVHKIRSAGQLQQILPGEVDVPG